MNNLMRVIWMPETEMFHIIPESHPTPNTVAELSEKDLPHFSREGFETAAKAWSTAIAKAWIDPENVFPSTIIYSAFFRKSSRDDYTWKDVLNVAHGDRELALLLLRSAKFEHLESLFEQWLKFDQQQIRFMFSEHVAQVMMTIKRKSLI